MAKFDLPLNGANKIALALVAAKKAEALAKMVRMDLEDKLATHPSVKKYLIAEGTMTFNIKDGCDFKIVNKMYRNVDQDMVKSDKWSDLPVEIRESVFRWKAELNLTQFKSLDKMNSKMANKVRKFFKVTPGRPAISVTLPTE